MNRQLTLAEQQQFYKEVKDLSEYIRGALTDEIIERINMFVRDTEQAATGKYDMSLLKAGELAAIKQNRINLQFWRTQAQNLLSIKNTAEDYIADRNRINVKSVD